jgi:hypothetical protein
VWWAAWSFLMALYILEALRFDMARWGDVAWVIGLAGSVGGKCHATESHIMLFVVG